MQNLNSKYDVAIIGSGIGGSTLAAILAGQGLSVVVFEAGAHPKFAVGKTADLNCGTNTRDRCTAQPLYADTGHGQSTGRAPCIPAGSNGYLCSD